MGLDIRFPLGMIFSALGLILLIYGTATNHDVMYAVSMDININIIWSVAMLVFGVATLGLASVRER